LYNEKNLPILIKLAIFTCSLVYVGHRESQMPSYCVSKCRETSPIWYELK